MDIKEYINYLSDESARIEALCQFREELSKKILSDLNKLDVSVEDIRKSYNTNKTQLYIHIQTVWGSINLTIHLLETIKE